VAGQGVLGRAVDREESRRLCWAKWCKRPLGILKLPERNGNSGPTSVGDSGSILERRIMGLEVTSTNALRLVTITKAGER